MSKFEQEAFDVLPPCVRAKVRIEFDLHRVLSRISIFQDLVLKEASPPIGGRVREKPNGIFSRPVDVRRTFKDSKKEQGFFRQKPLAIKQIQTICLTKAWTTGQQSVESLASHLVWSSQRRTAEKALTKS